MIEINGVAHIALTVSNWDRSRPFYEALLSLLGSKCVFSGEAARTACIMSAGELQLVSVAAQPNMQQSGSSKGGSACTTCASVAAVAKMSIRPTGF